MNALSTNRWIRGIVLAVLVMITPLLVLGDVHLQHRDHSCEPDQVQSFVDNLPWHPHGSCASDVDNEHFDLKSLIQKTTTIAVYDFPILSVKMFYNDHSHCQQAALVIDNSSYRAEDILPVLSVFLI